MPFYPVAKITEINPGERKIVTIKTIEIGLFNVEGKFYAIHNYCPHMGAPICSGFINRTVNSNSPGNYIYGEKLVIRCPWHRWEFDLESGECLIDTYKRIKTFELSIQDEWIYCKL